MKSQIKPLKGLAVVFPSGIKIYFNSIYYKVKICNKDFVKIKISPSESIIAKNIVSKVGNCRCSLEWLYLSLDNVIVNEGISQDIFREGF